LALICASLTNWRPIWDVNDYRISPYRGPLRDFLKLSHVGRIRFETDVNDLLLEHDLIRRGEVPVEQRRALILDHFGLKMVERTEQVTVWIATYDGRPLKDYRAVVAPVLAAGGERKTGAMIAKASPGFGLDALLRYLSLHQDLPIENETGIADQPLALECPSFEGPDGRDFAQTWFQEQFGIHFKEHAKDMTVWVVQRK